MSAPSSDRVTQLLARLDEGGDEARDDLFEHLYTEIRRRAREQRDRWKGDPVLQTTALAHEAYLKLVDGNEQSWTSQSHFLAVAGQAMRQILINEAERRRAQKRGGDTEPRSLEGLREALRSEVASAEEKAEVIVILNAALERFEAEHPRAARAVECRFFAGMTIEETAEALGVSTSTVSRDWDLAQAWLYREMKRVRGDKPSDEDDPA